MKETSFYEVKYIGQCADKSCNGNENEKNRDYKLSPNLASVVNANVEISLNICSYQ